MNDKYCFGLNLVSTTTSFTNLGSVNSLLLILEIFIEITLAVGLKTSSSYS